MQAAGAKVQAYDPEGHHEAAKLLKDVDYKTGPYEALDGADAMVILTEWDQFRALDLDRAKSLLKAPILVDLRNIYRSEQVEVLGFQYTGVGRG